MQCRQAQRLLSPYLDRELGANEIKDINEIKDLQGHLACCPTCREELEVLQGVSGLLREVAARVKAPEGFSVRVMARLEQQNAVRAAAAGCGAAGAGQPALAPAGSGSPVAGRQQGAAGAGNRWPVWRRYLAAAAAVAVLFGGTLALAWQYGPWGAPGSSVAVNEMPLTPPVVTEQPGGEGEGTATPSPETAVTEPVAPVTGGPEGQPEGVQAPGNEGLGASKPGQVTATKGAGDKEGAAGGEPRATDARVTATPAGPEAAPEVAAGGGKSGVRATGTVEVAAQPVEKQPPRAFLSTTRHTRSTLLELGVDDLAAARQAVQALARGRGGEVSSVIRVAAGEEIVRLVVPVENAEKLLGDLAKLGRVLDKGTQEKDITAEFNRKLAEYQELAGQESMTESDASLLASLESQLSAWDKESVEAGKEIINVWLKAGK